MWVCIGGGWGFDALLREQTRPHRDVDIVVLNDDLPQIRALLEAADFTIIRDADKWWNFVMSDGKGLLWPQDDPPRPTPP